MYQNIIRKIQTSGFEAYLVGGCVRDMLLGKEPSDYDICTNATYNQLRKIFPNENIDPIGKQFQVIIIDGIEIATYRIDNYDIDGRLVSTTPVSNIEIDLGRRDLTINSMAMNPITGNIIDLYKGQEDLKKGIIRFTGNTSQRIQEDPLRIIRACRFLSTLQFMFDKNTFFALQKWGNLLKDLPVERFHIEIVKALKNSKYPSTFFRALKNIDCLKYIFPSVNKLYGQDGGKFHNETIFEHSMDALDMVETDNYKLKLATLMHDVGKPLAYLLNSNGSFKKHDEIGSEIAEQELKSLKFSNSEVEYIKNMISIHMSNFNMDSSERVVRRLLVKFEQLGIDFKDFLEFRYADHGSNRMHKPYEQFEKNIFRGMFQNVIDKKQAFSIKDLAVDGNDVIEYFKIKPSKQVGLILNYLFECVINDPMMNSKHELFQLMFQLNLEDLAA